MGEVILCPNVAEMGAIITEYDIWEQVESLPQEIELC